MSKLGKSMKMKNSPHPGFSVLVDWLEPHGWSVTEGAKVLGVSGSALSHLVNEGADLSWDMAIRLSKAFGSRQFYQDKYFVKLLNKQAENEWEEVILNEIPGGMDAIAVSV